MLYQQHNQTRPTPSTEAGFTLIEVMVALVIFAFGILAVLGMQVTAIRGGHQSQNFSEAANAGANMIERLNSQDYAYLADGTDTVDGKYTLDWDVNENTSGELTDTKSIDLTVEWTEGGRTHEVAYEFLRAKDI